jgi:hypothetical protein
MIKKAFLHKIWIWIKRILHWFLKPLRKMRKIANKKCKGKKWCKLEFFLFYSTNLQTHLVINFFWLHFFPITYFYGFEISGKFCVCFILIFKNLFLGSLNTYVRISRTIRMQIRKKWLNQLRNFSYKHFKEYYLAPFCWWIPSSCENRCNPLVYLNQPPLQTESTNMTCTEMEFLNDISSRGFWA